MVRGLKKKSRIVASRELLAKEIQAQNGRIRVQ
jgi:hypothetical protein